MDKKTEILDKAMRIISEEGLDALSMSTLSKSVGLTKATLYHYFPSKDEIISEMMAMGHRRLMKNGFFLDLGGSPEVILETAAGKWEDLFLQEDNWHFLRVVFSLHFTHREASDEYRSLSLMLSSQAQVIVSAFKVKEETRRVLAPLISSLTLFTLERILEDEGVSFIEAMEGIISLIPRSS